MKRRKFWEIMLVVECIISAFWTLNLVVSAMTDNLSNYRDLINSISLSIVLAGICFYYWDKSKNNPENSTDNKGE